MSLAHLCDYDISTRFVLCHDVTFHFRAYNIGTGLVLKHDLRVEGARLHRGRRVRTFAPPEVVRKLHWTLIIPFQMTP